MCHGEMMPIEENTIDCDGVERLRTVECYCRDRTGDFDRECAGHGGGTSLLGAGGWRGSPGTAWWLIG